MKQLTITALCAAVLTATAAMGFAKTQPRPNVVIIYGDDVGWGDVGAYGAKLIPTPHIDRLAAEGLLFTDGHCSASTCTPSRSTARRVLPLVMPERCCVREMAQRAGRRWRFPAAGEQVGR